MAETVRYHIVNVSVKTFIEGDEGAQLVGDFSYNVHYTDGTAENQVGLMWNDIGRELDTTTEDLQLDNLSDFQGSASAFNNIKTLVFHNTSTTASELLTIGGSAGGNEWTTGPLVAAGDKMRVGPGGLILIVNPRDGYAVGAGDDLGVETSATMTYDAIIAGDH